MDLAMPRLDGAHAIPGNRSAFRRRAVIVLTTYDGDENIFVRWKWGSRYLLKDLPTENWRVDSEVHAGARTCRARAAARLAERTMGALVDGA